MGFAGERRECGGDDGEDIGGEGVGCGELISDLFEGGGRTFGRVCCSR